MPAFTTSQTLSLLVGMLIAGGAVAQPARIVLLRHAEKPANDAEIHLSEVGQQRARALASWATNSPAWGTNEIPSAVFACQPTIKAPSLRASETITPLAEKLHLPIQMPFPAKDPSALAKRILSDPKLKGKTVIICWARDELPELAASLGVKSGAAKWGKNVFNRAWVITFLDSGPILKEISQNLLPADSPR